MRRIVSLEQLYERIYMLIRDNKALNKLISGVCVCVGGGGGGGGGVNISMPSQVYML